MGKLIEGAAATVEIDGVCYTAEVRERSAELVRQRRERGSGPAKARALAAAEVA